MDGGRFKNWREVAGLPESVQRELLTAGDSAERVWSIWALGLRLGKAVLGDLGKDFDLEATPGIRCQLIAVMAGLGERDLVRTAALEDPDPVVRATACQYVVRTLPVGSPLAVDFAVERMQGDVPRIRHALLAEVLSDRLRLPDDVLRTLLADGDLETRQLSLEVLAASSALSENLLRALSDRVLAEQDSFLFRSAFDLYRRRGDPAALVRAVQEAPASVVCRVLTALKSVNVPLLWTDVASLAARSEFEIDLAILDGLVEPPTADAISWISGATAVLLEIPAMQTTLTSPLRIFQWKALTILYRAIAPDTIVLLDRSVAEALIARTAEDDEDEYEADPEGDRAELEDRRAKRALLQKRISAGSMS
jgi:hypothetical protein